MQANKKRSAAVRLGASATLSVLLCAGVTVPLANATPGTQKSLPVSDSYRPTADYGFHDYTRDGSVREIRNDLTGPLAGMVEFAQASTANPTGNSAAELPTTVAHRTALLMFTPTSTASSITVKFEAKGKVLGTKALDHPNLLPKSDQNYDSRGSVNYSLRAWSIEVPYNWMEPGLKLTFTDDSGKTGTIDQIDIAAPTEMVINNIQLGMVTAPPKSNNHGFVNDPVGRGTDYFHTIPISKLTMANYEPMQLDRVIVANGSIYDADNLDPSDGGVYSGTMRENVGKAQFSTGVNLATWGITSSAMNQRQPGYTNQRVIHHSAGNYAKQGVVHHGLSGGNGMATLWSSVGNELSHELGHSYGLGHYPGRNGKATGDDIIRNASHHMDSGWGYIPYRKVMRSNLNTGAFQNPVKINGDTFHENLLGKYSFGTDTMAGGWDISPISDYTHMTGYSLKRTQNFLGSMVADLSYPSGYRSWSTAEGEWVDAKELDPNFNLLKPKKIGGNVFTILGGYNPANPDQTLVYPAFRSNYGVSFNLPQSDPQSDSAARACWLEVEFLDQDTHHITLDAANGMKQLNVHIAEDEAPTSAQVKCRVDGVTTDYGNKISIATDNAPLAKAVVIGQEAGNSELRKKELSAMQPRLEAQSGVATPTVSSNDLLVLRGWADDLSDLNYTARRVAQRVLELDKLASDLSAYLAENPTDRTAVENFLEANDFTEDDGSFVPAASRVTVDNGACLYLTRSDDNVLSVKVDKDRKNCATTRTDTWFADAAGRIHPAQFPQYCLSAGSPVMLANCSANDQNQRWTFKDNGQIVKASHNGSALDFFVHQGYPGIYGSTGNANQIWAGIQHSSNPLIGLLGATGLHALWTALESPGDPQEMIVSPPAPEEMVVEPPAAEEGAPPADGGQSGPGLGSAPAPGASASPEPSTAPSQAPSAAPSPVPSTGTSASPAPSGSAGTGATDVGFSPDDDAKPDHLNDKETSSGDNVDNENPYAGEPLGVEDHSGHNHDEESEDGTHSGELAAGAEHGTDAAQQASVQDGDSLASTGTNLLAGVLALMLFCAGAAVLVVRKVRS